MKKYTIIRRDNQEKRENIEARSAEDAVYWAFGDKVRYFGRTETKEIYVTAGHTRSYLVEELKTAELISKDILKMVEYMCNQDSIVRDKVTSGCMEELLVNAIRYVTRVDFTGDIKTLHEE